MRAKKKWQPEGEFPCAIPLCMAMVEIEGQRCKIHRFWTNGPHTDACVRCRQPIVAGDLWRLLDGEATQPVHAPCVAGKNRSMRNPRRTWDKGFGSLL